MKHIDLFSGIGGFAYAAAQIWGEEYENILFCDNDPFCQAVLRKHWPRARIYGDIRELIAHAKSFGFKRSNPSWEKGKIQYGFDGSSEQLIADTRSHGLEGEKFPGQGGQSFSGGSGCGPASNPERIGHLHGESEIKPAVRHKQTPDPSSPSVCSPLLLTGGFPCQPFSNAGNRGGTDDNRYLWPEMLKVIRFFKPSWVIAENVYGILNIEGGMVFEQVCLDLEEEGYEVRAFIIPACAVNAWHRRDRVWFIGNSKSNHELGNREYKKRPEEQIRRSGCDAPDTECGERTQRGIHLGMGREQFKREAWGLEWKQVAASTCIRGVDDGIPEGMDDISQARHRTERLKMLGNSIVPQVAMEIMKAIKESEEHES